jgi:tRNA A37 threonylcarbamoyladenosine modification protein TsaB
MPAIDRAMLAAGLSPVELGLVAVSVGPGGFTAVRIAVTVARMIAEVSRSVVVAVPSASVAAASVPVGDGPFAVALASKGEDAFVTRFERPFVPSVVPAGVIMRAEGLDGLGVGLLVADSFLPAAMRAWADAKGVPVVPPIFDPRACLRLAASLPTVDVIDLSPMYPREPEAVRKWRELHPKR